MFEVKYKIVLFGFMGFGFLCLVLSVFGDDDFLIWIWFNYLYNFVFFLGIGFVFIFVFIVFIIVYVGWYLVLQCVWEVFFFFFVLGLVLMLILVVVVVFDWNYLYYWVDEVLVVVDLIFQGKVLFFNNIWYGLGIILVVGIWVYFVYCYCILFCQEDEMGMEEYEQYKKIKKLLVIFLLIVGFISVVMIWQWVMSVDVYWYSILYVWYFIVFWFVVIMVLIIMLLIWLKFCGYYENVSMEYFYDLGKYFFVFSVFWMYLWFSQYMLIWYVNNGEEMVYF